MKISDYICNKCKHEYEVKTTIRGVMSSNTDTLNINCPKCGSDYVSKVFTPINFKIDNKE